MGGECLRRANAMSRGGLNYSSRVSKALKNLQIVLRQIWSTLHKATPNRHMLPLVQSTTWRSEVVIAKVIMTARTRRMRVNEADEDPGATS